jgi:hypothetical protein
MEIITDPLSQLVELVELVDLTFSELLDDPDLRHDLGVDPVDGLERRLRAVVKESFGSHADVSVTAYSSEVVVTPTLTVDGLVSSIEMSAPTRLRDVVLERT